MADNEEKKGEGEANTAEAAGAAPKSKAKLIMIIGSLVVLLVAIGVPVYMFVLKPASKPVDEVGEDAAQHDDHAVPEGVDDEDELEEDEQAIGAIFPLDTFVVNLTGTRYVRTQVQFEFLGRDVPKRFYARIVLIRDGIIDILGKRSPEDLLSEKGKRALKSDIRDFVNELLRKEEVKAVYFTQFVVQ